MNARANLVREISPSAKARAAALLFLATILMGGIGQTIQDGLVVPTDAGVTAANVLAHTPQLWAGFAIYILELAVSLASTALLYDLLKPAGRNTSLLAAWFSVVGITVKTVSRLFYIAPMFLLGDAPYLNAFTQAQVRTLALFSFHLNARGAGVAMVFFGFYAVLTGYLIIKSTFLPRFLGVLGVLGGLGWLTFLSPTLGLGLVPYLVPLALSAALAKILWFLIKGVDEARWREQAHAARASIWA